MLALKDGAAAALPPQFTKFARRLSGFFKRSAERKADFRTFDAELREQLEELVRDVDGLSGEFDRALKFPKGYVATRWLSLQQFADSCVASAYPLYMYLGPAEPVRGHRRAHREGDDGAAG